MRLSGQIQLKLSEVHGVSSNRDLPSTSQGVGQPKKIATAYDVSGVLRQPRQQYKSRLLMCGVGIFVTQFMALGGSIVSLGKKISSLLIIGICHIHTVSCMADRPLNMEKMKL